MATVTPEAPKAPEQSAAKQSRKSQSVTYRDYVDTQLRRTRSQVKWVEIGGAIITLAIAVLGTLLLVALFDHWVFPLGTFLRWTVLIGIVAGAGAYTALKIVPLFVRRINSVYAAHTIEEHSPTLKNSLVNLLMLRGSRDTVSRSVLKAVESQAATGLSHVPVEAAVDRSKIIKLGYVLLGIFVVLAAYALFSPKSTLATVKRIAAPWADIDAPTRVIIEEVTPGDTSVFAQEFVEVEAKIDGVDDDEPVTLFFSTSDRRVVDRPLPMKRPAGSLGYQAVFPQGTDGLQEGVEYSYYVTAGDARSQTFVVTVNAPPRIAITKIEYDFPPYTRRPKLVWTEHGGIAELEGTQVTITAEANQAIGQAAIDFNCDGRPDVTMQVQEPNIATATFRLPYLQREGRQVAPAYQSYQITFTNKNGDRNTRPIRNNLDIIPDRAPRIEIAGPPQPVIEVALNGTARIDVLAEDVDYALSNVSILAERHNVAGDLVLNETLLVQERQGEFKGSFNLQPQKHGLQVGDEIRYWAQARDNRHEYGNLMPNVAKSAMDSREPRRIKVVAAVENPQQQNNEQQDQAGDQGQDNQDQDQGNNDQQDQGQQDQGQNDDNQNQDGQQDQKGQAGDQSIQQNDQGQSGDQQQGDQQQAGSGGEQNQNSQQNGSGGESQDQAGGEQNSDKSNEGNQQGNQQQNPFETLAQKSQPPQQEQNKQQSGQPQNDQQQPGGQQQDQNQQEKTEQNQQQDGQSGSQQDSAQKDGAQQDGAQQDNTQQGAQQGGQDQSGNQQQKSGQGGANDAQKQNAQDTGGDDNKSGDQAGAANQNNQGGDNQSAQQQNNDSANSDKTGAQDANQDNSQRQQGDQSGDQRKDAGQGSQGDQQKDAQKDGQQPDKSGGAGSPKDNAASGQAGEGGSDQKNTSTPGDPENKQKETSGTGTDEQKQNAKQSDEEPGVDNSRNEDRAGDATTSQEGAAKGEADKPKGKDDASQTGGTQNDERGGSGAGSNNNDAGKGSPEQYEEQRVKNEKKQQNEGNEKPLEKNEAPAGSTSKKESDSKGDSEGDRSGGGGTGGGQQANSEGSGGGGSNTAADEGANAAGTKGNGETGNKAGEDVKSEDKTGQAGEEKGNGSGARQGEGERGEGTRPKDGAQGDQNSQDDNAPPKDGQQKSNQQDQPGQQNEQQSDDIGSPDSEAGGQPGSGGTRGVEQAPRQADGEPGGDELDKDSAEKATDLILANKDALLENYESDEDLQQLFPDKDALRQYLDNLQQLRQQANQAGEEGEIARNALRKLQSRQISGGTEADDMSGVIQGASSRAPAEYADQARNFSRRSRKRNNQ